MKRTVISTLIISILFVASCSKPECPEPDPTSGTPGTTSNNDNLKVGLAAHYPFTGNAGDSSGYSNNGTVNGAVLTSDRFGNSNRAYSFDGSNDEIIISPGNLMNINYTYSMWVNTAQNAYVGVLISIGSVGGDQTININNSMGWQLGSYNSDNSGSSVNSGSLVTINQWNHIVATRDNSSIKLYVNGQIIQTTSIGSLSPSYGPNTKYATIGVRGAVASQYFNGSIDDVRIYNRALSAAEVLQLYQLN